MVLPSLHSSAQAVQLAVFGWDDDFGFPVPMQVRQNRRTNGPAKIHTPKNCAFSFILFQSIKPSITSTTQCLDFAVAIEISGDKITDRRLQGKCPPDLARMASFPKDDIGWTHRA